MKKKKTTAKPPLQIEAPREMKLEAKGSPLRPEQFPSIEQTAGLAAKLANGKAPSGDNEAQELTSAALRLWRIARDEINEQRARSSSYWQTIDQCHAGITDGYAKVKARLEKMGCAEYFMREEVVTWPQAAEMLWKHLPQKTHLKNLEQLVSSKMAGQGSWKDWKLSNFRELGFKGIGFTALVQHFDEQEEALEQARLRHEMSEKGKRSAANRKARRGWGKLSSSTTTKITD
ncbi:MAG: hypothetical protein E6Q97_06380 [Desulfurellales bacterium]|nr:MAG: hypothetical protein E6Q97_06380 [Desulfurellales bacterium]